MLSLKITNWLKIEVLNEIGIPVLHWVENINKSQFLTIVIIYLINSLNLSIITEICMISLLDQLGTVHLDF